MTDEILLTCPKCSEVLCKKQIAGMELDMCSACGGLWFDKGELVKFKLRADFWDADELEVSASARKAPPSSLTVKLPCPGCDETLGGIETDGVVIDVCRGCQGVWLDKGELKPALSALGKNADSALLDAILGL